MLKVLSAGESHGPTLTAVLDGLPSGITIDLEFIDRELRRRQHGYGRGRRMTIERDHAEITAGVRHGRTTGAPVGLAVINNDHVNWRTLNDGSSGKVTRPRPGHADLAGALKYGHDDIRNVIERASARETAIRVAAGAVFKLMLREFDIPLWSHTVAVGGLSAREPQLRLGSAEHAPLRCLDPVAEGKMMKLIDRCARKGDSLGGITEIVAMEVCPGLGSYVQFDRRIDALIGMAMMSIPSVKGIEIGTAFANASRPGHAAHDEIYHNKVDGFLRKTNRAGGIEGGMTNGEPLVVRLAVKPIPSLKIPLRTVDMATMRKALAHQERADTCVVPAAGVIGEAMLAYVITDVFLEKFGRDNMDDIRAGYGHYLDRIKNG